MPRVGGGRTKGAVCVGWLLDKVVLGEVGVCMFIGFWIGRLISF